ncbi:MAG: FtsQ-type POTRA domain-containing protein [Gemmatimonadetes bacterium]|nr:FtsQ-type POTRA domain-containing protein [Gemmatimonadota bacterium]
MNDTATDIAAATPSRLAPWKLAAAGIAAALLLASPLWGRALLRRMSFFNVRAVQVEGVRYLDPGVVVARLRIDTTVSLFDDGDTWVARVEGHPQVAAVEVSRTLPGTLVVRITEVPPVALVPAADGLVAIDAAGRRLPVDASRVPMDLPVLGVRDRRLVALLDTLRAREPALYASLSEVRREGRELRIDVAGLQVRAPLVLSAGRIAEIVPVTDDLARRHVRVAELDLRYRDQVIARLQ